VTFKFLIQLGNGKYKLFGRGCMPTHNQPFATTMPTSHTIVFVMFFNKVQRSMTFSLTHCKNIGHPVRAKKRGGMAATQSRKEERYAYICAKKIIGLLS
jgi:hypothetical protein